MNIKGIAFDLEGTVVNVEPAHHEGHFATAKEVGVEIKSVEEALEKIPHFIGGPDEAITAEIFELSDKKKPLEFIIERDKYHYQRLLKESVIEPRPGFLMVVKELQDLGIKISIGSLTAKMEATTLLNSSGLDKIFSRDVTVLREDVKNIKPAPDVFLETAKRMGIGHGEQLVFEDSPRGVAAAITAGSLAIGMPVYNLPKTVNALKEAGVVRVYASWEEINVKELLEFLEKSV